MLFFIWYIPEFADTINIPDHEYTMIPSRCGAIELFMFVYYRHILMFEKMYTKSCTLKRKITNILRNISTWQETYWRCNYTRPPKLNKKIIWNTEHAKYFQKRAVMKKWMKLGSWEVGKISKRKSRIKVWIRFRIRSAINQKTDSTIS